MRIKTSELRGLRLDWAVAQCEGYTPLRHTRLANVMVEKINARGVMQPEHLSDLKYSLDWAQGGPIIEREGIDVYCTLIGRPDHENISWQKSNWRARYSRMGIGSDASFGHSALEAAMRCYCCGKLGDYVDIPEELLCEPPKI